MGVLGGRAEPGARLMPSGVETGALRGVPQHPRTQTEPCNTPLNPRRRISNKYYLHLTTSGANSRLHPGKGQREILRVEECCWVQAHDMSYCSSRPTLPLSIEYGTNKTFQARSWPRF